MAWDFESEPEFEQKLAWMINGHKWFTTNGSVADFLVVMCVTNPSVHPYQGCPMIIVPTSTPGERVLRDIPTMENPVEGGCVFGGHSEIVYKDVRVPYENLVGEEGKGFPLAQKRLGPGRIHHAIRWLSQSRRAFGMLCERAESRFAHGPDEVHKVTVARHVLKGYKPVEVPTEHVPTRRPAARKRFAWLLDQAAVST